ncbi:MAG: type 4a pilus biogenesis protein PilO [Pseudomonadota bacterium]
MNLSDLQNLSLDNIGTWPIPVKIAGALLVFAALIFAGWYYDIKQLQETLASVQEKEGALRTSLEGKQKKAANLPALRQQLEDIKETFDDQLKRLPDKTQVAELLVDISQQGLGSGLEFSLFKPGSESPSEFYVELPISIKVIGEYHEFGNFISGISDLPRIVTSHDIKIAAEGDQLALQLTAKTYRYIDEEGN